MNNLEEELASLACKDLFEDFLQKISKLLESISPLITPPPIREKSLLACDAVHHWEGSIEPCSQVLQNLSSSSQILSSHVTKLALGFSQSTDLAPIVGPFLVAILKVCQQICQTTSNIFPYHHGKTWRTAVIRVVQDVLKAVVEFIHSIQSLKQSQRSIPPTEEVDPQRFLTATGIVWDACASFEKLPFDNQDAVFRQLSNIEGLINDAYDELEDTMTEFCGNESESSVARVETEEMECEDFIDGEDIDSVTWSIKDKQVLFRTKAIVLAVKKTIHKLIHSTFKKMKDSKTTVLLNSFYDDVLMAANLLSP
eukprot:Sdes_comp16161_c0_seq1m5408